MRLLPIKLILVSFLSLWMIGCTYPPSGAQVGTAVGAGAGALAGYAIAPNNAVGAVIGAGAGALIGRQVGRVHDQRVYESSYYERRYYRGY